LRCYYTNATSLNNKLSSLNALACSQSPHVIFISETWFNDHSCTKLTGYSSFLKNRPSHGGGVAIFVSEEIEAFEVQSPSLQNELVEQVWCGLKVGKDKILAGCLYRPPPKSSDKPRDRQALESAISRALTTASNLVRKGEFTGLCVSGDFNYNKTQWDSEGTALCSGGPSLPDHKFIEVLSDNSIHQAVSFPTFVNASGNCTNFLDLILTENEDRVFNLEAGPPLSDDAEQFHLSLQWNMALAEAHRPSFERSNFNYNKANFNQLNEELNRVPWSEIFTNKNINESYEIFIREYERIVDLCVPKQSRLGRKVQPPWMTKDLAHLIAKKKHLWIVNQHSGSTVKAAVNEEYKKVRKELKKATKRAVIDYEKTIINDKVNKKRVFSYVKAKQKTTKSISAMNDTNGNTVHSGQEISQILNAYFKSVFVEENGDDELPDFAARTSERVSSASLSIVDISKRLEQLDPHKAPGADGIHPQVLKACHETIAVPLALIFYKSLQEGEIPDKWRDANVTPLHKKGSRLDPANYRPVSLTSIPCKILERIIRDTVMDHLYRNNLIAKQQHGFVRNKACVTNLLETIDQITSTLAYRQWVDVIFLDFAKAFDKVPHRRLVHKLAAYGISGKLLEWIKSFLRGRRQRVVMGNNVSEWEQVTSGVPQGSVLGPLLFVIYINDIPEVIKHFSCKLYADDSKLIAEIKDEQDAINLQHDIDCIVKWTDTWLMRLNYDKCKVMHFGFRNPKYKYTMLDSNTEQSIAISPSDSERDLGITITSDAK
jgi:hypothetical protein